MELDIDTLDYDIEKDLGTGSHGGLEHYRTIVYPFDKYDKF